jgi:hypothetical protein
MESGSKLPAVQTLRASPRQQRLFRPPFFSDVWIRFHRLSCLLFLLFNFMDALEAASADQNIVAFARFIREEMSVDWTKKLAKG